LDNSDSEVRITADSTPSACGVVPPDVHSHSLLHSNMPQVMYMDHTLHYMDDES